MAAAVFVDGVIRDEAMGLAMSSPYHAFADLLRVLERSVGTMAKAQLGAAKMPRMPEVQKEKKAVS
jgi:hypothetical protein